MDNKRLLAVRPGSCSLGPSPGLLWARCQAQGRPAALGSGPGSRGRARPVTVVYCPLCISEFNHVELKFASMTCYLRARASGLSRVYLNVFGKDCGPFAGIGLESWPRLGLMCFDKVSNPTSMIF